MTAFTEQGRANVVHVDALEPISWSGEESGRFILEADDTGGAFSYYQVVVPAGQGTVLHRHDDMDETFHVVGGEFEITVGPERHHAGAGTVVLGPRGVAHGFLNVGDGPGTLLCITAPGGIEHFFRELSGLLHADPPAGWDELKALAARHHITTYPARQQT